MAGKMAALVFAGETQIELAMVDKPQLVHPTDAIVRVTLCGICGSDLHPYHGREQGILPGTVVGHEFVGTIEQVGDKVTDFKPGQRVMSPFTCNCGSCYYCRKGLTCRCSHPHAHVFGWLSKGEDALEATARRGLHGSQAQYVRVPLADATLMQVPEGVSDEEGVLLGDILSTAFFCAERGEIQAGDVVAVVGCGPVGLLAILAARHLGAKQVFAIDRVESRLQMAAGFGAWPINFAQEDPLRPIHEATNGRGVDVALEVVGLASALELSMQLLRPAGTLSSVGVHTNPQFPFSPVDGYNKNLTYRSGRCPARQYMAQLLPLVLEKKYNFTDIITHRLPLTHGPAAYRMFDQKQDGCIKVVLDPWS